METEGSFQFKIIMHVLVSSFRFIRIPVLWVYDHYKYYNSFSGERFYTSESDVYRRQCLTHKDDPCAERVKKFAHDYNHA